jgi:hypothetical protein
VFLDCVWCADVKNKLKKYYFDASLSEKVLWRATSTTLSNRHLMLKGEIEKQIYQFKKSTKEKK